MNKRLLQALLLFGVMVCLFSVATLEQYEIDNHAAITVNKSVIPIATYSKRDESNYLRQTYENPYDFSDIVIKSAVKEVDKMMLELKNTSDKEEWFKRYKEVIEKNSLVLDPPESIYDYFSDEELELFFRVVQAEVGDENTFEQKCNVAAVILNRIEHDRFDNEMFKILTSDQFCTIRNDSYKNVEVSESTILACEYVYEIEDPTDGCLFFDNNGTLKYQFVFSDGAHNFYKLKED